MNPAKIGKNIVAGAGKFVILGGPCVAEGEEICMEIAQFLKKACADRGIQYVFKASFDKANRSSGKSFRGFGMEEGLRILASVKKNLELPVVTDIHESCQAEETAKVADILQIPAFLCRQTDLLVAAAKTGKAVNVKKGQFLAPEDMKSVVGKLADAGCKDIMLTERGTSFGYHNLVVDMRGLQTMREMGHPVIFDATHSVQLPGGLGNASDGQREFIPALSRAAAAVGIDGLFMEVHPHPEKALSDGPNSLDFAGAERVMDEVLKIYELTRQM